MTWAIPAQVGDRVKVERSNGSVSYATIVEYDEVMEVYTVDVGGGVLKYGVEESYITHVDHTGEWAGTPPIRTEPSFTASHRHRPIRTASHSHTPSHRPWFGGTWPHPAVCHAATPTRRAPRGSVAYRLFGATWLAATTRPPSCSPMLPRSLSFSRHDRR